MADFVVGVSDGYHSIAFADGLEPAGRRPFSITGPSALTQAEKDVPSGEPALAEIRTGNLADHKA
ncbi:hypothetical protein DFW101_3015 [Solidesulfovibrio carbinoliphilus subsp. oakridgensis]|uniref:Uncharacterized protein n=1 Tax=Solidesulfovibrio carbinoliphilus subsp. oakridgensis TaxID=694327 RepID=G7Q758_9BACT|nr:hypothetical protein [Solidesulfovibrio carbinoliphilus]EHJ49015.1 hypothetical protein DFW101_3015 [Solidesulfovibrio carbinoliphilus subsp. oakridgensis]